MLLELVRFLYNAFFLRLGKGSRQLRHLFIFDFLSLRSKLVIGSHKKPKPVVVGQNILLYQILKQLPFLELFPNPLTVLIHLEKAERIASMETKRDDMRQIAQANVLLGLLGSKLHLVKHTQEQTFVKSIFRSQD